MSAPLPLSGARKPGSAFVGHQFKAEYSMAGCHQLKHRKSRCVSSDLLRRICNTRFTEKSANVFREADQDAFGKSYRFSQIAGQAR